MNLLKLISIVESDKEEFVPCLAIKGAVKIPPSVQLGVKTANHSAKEESMPAKVQMFKNTVKTAVSVHIKTIKGKC